MFYPKRPDVTPIIIYLAGPIDGIPVEAGKNWREEITLHAPSNVLFYSPAHAFMTSGSKETAPAIDYMNRVALSHSNAVLANLLGDGRAFGTMREIEQSRAQRKPCAVAGELSDSLMSWDIGCFSTVEEALDDLLIFLVDLRKHMEEPSFMGIPIDLLRPPRDNDDDQY